MAIEDCNGVAGAERVDVLLAFGQARNGYLVDRVGVKSDAGIATLQIKGIRPAATLDPDGPAAHLEHVGAPASDHMQLQEVGSIARRSVDGGIGGRRELDPLDSRKGSATHEQFLIQSCTVAFIIRARRWR